MKKNYMPVVVISMFAVNALFAQISFTRQDFGLRGASYGAAEFGDFDGDGDLDLLVIGEEDIGSKVGVIYVNEGGSFNSESFITLPYEFASGDAKWADYDHDGDLDILITGDSGGGLTAVLRNDDGTFAEVDFGLLNMKEGAVDWADYDSDGDLDFAVTGYDFNFKRPLKIYKNQDGGYVDSDIMLPGLESGDLEWIDFDNDGDMDIFITGSNGGRQSILYKNDMNEFSDAGFSFVPMLDASCDFGDFDSDGDMDLLLSGNGNDGNLEPRTVIYRNDIDNFTRMSFVIDGLEKSDVKWADFDNDGDLDFIQSGKLISGDNVTEVYENTGSGFTKTNQVFSDSLTNSAIAVGDYDRDGDVDFALSGWNDKTTDRVTVIYSNDTMNKNTKPLRPQTSEATTAGDGSYVSLNWGKGSDTETPQTGLSYNIKVGTVPGADDIVSAHITGDGAYMLSRRGNMESRLSWKIYNLPPGTYYWAVQTVDNSFAVSNFLSSLFTISVSPTFQEIDAGLPALQYGDMAWGDYDADGTMDLVVVGLLANGDPLAKIYKYDSGSDALNDAGVTINGSPYANVQWGDYDNDGDLDLLTGNTLYNNNFGNLNFVMDFSPSQSDLSFVDYDNDGDLDIFWAKTGNLYRNDAGTFTIDTEASQAINSLPDGRTAWGDYDNDGDKDLIISGGNFEAHLYRNDNGHFVDWGYDFDATSYGQTFGYPTNGFKSAAIAWGDYDNDGDLDFIIDGEAREEDSGTTGMVTIMYRNDGQDPINKGQWLFTQTEEERYWPSRMYPGVFQGTVNWADFDNNGLRDFIISGSVGTTENATDYLTRIYTNTGTDQFVYDSVTNESLRGMGSGSAGTQNALAVVDIDKDGDLDFVEFGYSGITGGLGYAARLYKNTLNDKVINDPPMAPGNLRHIVKGDTAWLMWDAAEDDKSTALTYNVRIGTESGGQDVVSACAFSDGILKMAFEGNAQSAKVFKIDQLPANKNFFWSVQAIDPGLKSSPFAQEATFNTFSPSISITAPSLAEILIGGEPDTITWNSNNIENIKIEFSANGAAPWNTVESSWPAADGQYTWTVPEVTTVTAKIRISAVTNPDINAVSPQFAIAPRYVSLNYPNGGEVFHADSTISIDWFSPYTSDFKLEYSLNNGVAWTEISVINETYGQSSDEWTIPDTTSEECKVRVTDINHPTVSNMSKNTFSIIGNTKIAINSIDFNHVIDLGSQDTVRVTVNNIDITSAVKIYFKAANSQAVFNEENMNLNGDNYQYPLKDAPLGGFRFYIKATDINSNTSTSDTMGIRINIKEDFQNADENVGGNNVANYVLFSIPVELADKSPAHFLIINNFDDTPDPQNYRFYSYENGSTNNFIEYDKSGFGQMTIGKGFFIISNDDFNMKAGAGTTLDPSKTYSIQGLKKGWNLIGNPFPYSIPVGNISTQPNTVNFTLWAWDGGWTNVQSGDLVPWKGYALNLTDDAYLKIPPYHESLGKASPVFTTLNNNNDEWMIRIKARNGSAKSNFNFVGQLFNAAEGKDRFDINGPPRLLKQVVLSFNNKEESLQVTDIRKSNNTGHVWEFTCYTDPRETMLNLVFDGIGSINPSFDVFLIDENSSISYNLKNKNELQFAAKGLDQKNFKLIAGSKDFINNLQLENDLYPVRFALKQNFPNPFNPITQVSFTIKEAGVVKLAVYDLLGREVTVLVDDHLKPGNYNAVWDASAQSSGIYFIRLTSGSHLALKRAILIK